MPKNNQLKRKPPKARVILSISAIVFVIAAAAYGCVYLNMNKMNEGAADIVEKPAVVSTPASTALLEPIEGTPSDIDEDYIAEVPESTQEPIYKQIPISEEVINILILGTDVRPNETGNGRTDSMMLLSYNRDTQTAKLTSFMRDVWVHIPARGWNRINASYAFGGIGLSVNTINENFGLDIQNYIVLDFEGFKKIVDELGGIEVILKDKEIKYINELSQTQLKNEEGNQLLNGEQMLIHCRNRKTGDGDFGRTQRQRDVMLAFFNKAKTVRDPILLAELLSFALNNVQTNMTPDMLFTLGLEVVASKAFKLEQGRIPFDNTWRYANEDGRSVISIDLEENTHLLHEFLYGEITGD